MAEKGVQAHAVHEFHHQVEVAAFLPEVENLDHMGAADGRHDAGLVEEALENILAGGEIGVQDLDGHEAGQDGILGEEDLRHRALTELIEYFVTSVTDGHRSQGNNAPGYPEDAIEVKPLI
jgi:hypothetical protein